MEISNLNNALKAKISDSIPRMILLGVIAGIFISLGATLFGVATSFGPEYRLIGAALFSIGLILVVFLKVQLFTGNNLMIIPLITGEEKFKPIARNWAFVYMGNFIGAMLAVSFAFVSVTYFEDLSQNLVSIAKLKTGYGFVTALGKAILCNTLVCLAITLGVTLSSPLKKTVGIIIPITIFVFMGFEHSIANMFFIPLGLFLEGVSFEVGVQLFLKNIIPVTIGNILGGLVVSTILILKFNDKN